MTLLDTLLLIGGPDSDRSHLREIFQDDYNLLEAVGVEQGLFLLKQNRHCIVSVIVDRPPPKGPGDSFLQEAREQQLIGDIPMLAIINPSGTGQWEELAFSLGASDVVPRPYTPAIIRRRIHLMVDLFRSRRNLLSALRRQADTIRHTNEVMVDALSSIIEHRSAESGIHTLRIRRFTEILMKEVARSCPEYELTPDDISSISSAAALHDIGKISIPDHILGKPGKLTAEEMEVMKGHTVDGSKMIESLSGATSEEYLRYAYNICRSHHERWDGRGYPDGLKENDIPICAQVVGLADVFDALTTDRVYKAAIPPAEAVNMILNQDPGHFSPQLLTCFKRVVRSFMDLAGEYAHGHSPHSDTISLPLPKPTDINHEIGSLQISQMKYQALLHFSRATVIEMDADYHTFHVVYNPFPNFMPMPDLFPLEKPLTEADFRDVHPEDLERVLEEFQFLRGEFFAQSLRTHSFSYRSYSHTLDSHRPYRVTFLRLNTGNPRQRKAILVWQPASPLPSLNASGTENSVQANKANLVLMSNIICRKNDGSFSVEQGLGILSDLLGYSIRELQEDFHGRYLELILPEDRDSYRQQVADALRVGTLAQTEYRVRHKDGRILWILEKGCLTTDEEGREYFYGALTDNTRSHRVQAELEEALQRSQSIIAQSDDIIFDWDILGNQVQLSPNWESTFGYEPPLVLESEMLPQSRIHPDDLEAVSELGKSVQTGADRPEAELRIANSENKYIWCRLRLTPIRDNAGAITRVVGTLSNIDSAKRAWMSLQEQAQQDSLTGLLNKASTHNAIRDYLDSHRAVDCALLMIDLDNFKAINDQYGHLFGDTVLTRVSKTIQRLFRGGDIMGRVGGDEFMVLMKDVRDRQLVRDRCQLLLTELSALFAGEVQGCEPSCSVGVALAPEHGSSFQDLFRHADQALYHAKQLGKHRFSFFESDLNTTIQQFSTPIDSNEQPHLNNSDLVRGVFHQLTRSTDLEQTIREVLALVGQRAGVSRVYIFENNDDNTHCSNTFEWCNEGISPEIDNLQNICYATDLPNWENNYDENGILFCPDIRQMAPGPRAILEPQGIKSMLHCAIRENGVFRGYIGLDECESNRIWTREQVDILTFLSEVVTTFLLKKRALEKAASVSDNLMSILDNQHNEVYVVNPASHRLLFANDRAKASSPHLTVGELCHRAISGCDAPCEGCPMALLGPDGFGQRQVFRRSTGITVTADASSIRWDGRPACLVVCWKQH